MKKVTKLLLINWYGYSLEVIDFDMINFLTGKTASGKSTIIDALQLVVLGDTNGNFFNKAANEKSVRTLKSYLFGENGDDGASGFHYLRKGPFSSYVALEFLDTERDRRQLIGICCDCHADLTYEQQWFVLHRAGLPENNFTDPKTQIPYNISQLKAFLNRTVGKNNYEFCASNKRYRDVTLSVFGNIKEKYRVLLKKAVPFTPITDIEKFITESICDVKNEIHVDEMQSDIRQYKNLEFEAEQTQKRIGALDQIASVSRQYEAAEERYRQQDYIVARAELEELLQRKAYLESQAGKLKEKIASLHESFSLLEKEIRELEVRTEELQEQYHTSDLAKREETLRKQLEELRKQITAIEDGISRARAAVSQYGSDWAQRLMKIKPDEFAVSDAEKDMLREMASVTGETILCFDFLSASREMNSLKERLRDFRQELRKRSEQLKEEIRLHETRIGDLKKGIKPYPSKVTGLRSLLEGELFRQYHKTVTIPIFADLLEIRDETWTDAIEGYLDQQKFNLIVPPEYFEAANVIYNGVKKEQKLYDTGLVDIGKLRRAFTKTPQKGSLAEEIQTEDRDARLYADFLLGNVMKCEDVRNLGKFRIGITREVMLYKGYVSRKLNPARYADHFIGKRSLESLLKNEENALSSCRKEEDEVLDLHRRVMAAAEAPALEHFEAEQYVKDVSESGHADELRKEQEAVQKEYDSLDFTFLEKLREEIRAADYSKRLKNDKKDTLNRTIGSEETELRHIVEVDLPACEQEQRNQQTRIAQNFPAEWVEQTGEKRFQEELAGQGTRREMSLRESFRRAREATRTITDNLRKQRNALRGDYNRDYRMPYDINREDNQEYDGELATLRDIRLPDYIDKIKDAKEKAYTKFSEDFIAKLKSNIESVTEQIRELNDALRHSVFGTDRYRFTYSPRAEYRNYYDMITDPMLMDTGGWNIASANFNQKYQKEIDSLFKMLILNETDVSAERRSEYEKNIRKFTDYKTYLVFDLIVTNDQGEEQRLSKTLLKKSGGETQIPFYIALLASFSQVCRIGSRNNQNTIRLIILDEAFSKMDGERIQESIRLLRKFQLQAVFSAPPEKIPDIAPLVDRNIAVYKVGHRSFTKYFSPKEIEDSGEPDAENPEENGTGSPQTRDQKESDATGHGARDQQENGAVSS